MTLDSLNALSNDELLKLGESLGLEIPRGLERPFLIGEILEAAKDQEPSPQEQAVSGLDLRKAEVEAAVDADQSDPAAVLPQRYSENCIHAMVRDPEWAYLYWDLREEERLALRDGDQRQLSIRVLELASAQDQPQNALSWFEFQVQPEDGEWFVNLPEDGAGYVFEIAALSGQERRLIARSNVVTAPRRRRAEDFARLPRRTRVLMELAGLYKTIQDERPAGDCRRIIPVEAAGD